MLYFNLVQNTSKISGAVCTGTVHRARYGAHGTVGTVHRAQTRPDTPVEDKKAEKSNGSQSLSLSLRRNPASDAASSPPWWGSWTPPTPPWRRGEQPTCRQWLSTGRNGGKPGTSATLPDASVEWGLQPGWSTSPSWSTKVLLNPSISQASTQICVAKFVLPHRGKEL